MDNEGASKIIYRVWMFGAGLIGFGLGVLLAAQVNAWFGAAILILGIAIHGWGMFRIYQR